MLHKTNLPLGAMVSISEVPQDNVTNVGVSVSPANRDTGSVAPTASFKVGTGVTTATFTNEAFGTLEICKIGQDASTDSQTFQFTVNGGAPISVHAGQCTPAISVPAGHRHGGRGREAELPARGCHRRGGAAGQPADERADDQPRDRVGAVRWRRRTRRS